MDWNGILLPFPNVIASPYLQRGDFEDAAGLSERAGARTKPRFQGGPGAGWEERWFLVVAKGQVWLWWQRVPGADPRTAQDIP